METKPETVANNTDYLLLFLFTFHKDRYLFTLGLMDSSSVVYRTIEKEGPHLYSSLHVNISDIHPS